MNRRILRSDKLDELANSIRDDMLHSLIDANSLKWSWRYKSNATHEYIDDFRCWIDVIFAKDNGNICLIAKTNDPDIWYADPNTYYSTFVLFDDPERLYTTLSKTLKLRVFL